MKLLTLALTVLFTFSSFAMNDTEVYELVTKGSVVKHIAFKDLKISKNDKAVIVSKMKKVATYLSDTWADTILEGPYHLLNTPKLEVDSVEGIYYKNRIIGYLGYVRADAAMIDSCPDEEENSSEYRTCIDDNKGAIYERFLVNAKGEHIEEFQEPAEFDSY